MEKEKIIEVVNKSIADLFNRIKDYVDGFYSEANIHFDLYYLLNNNCKRFWDEYAVEAESEDWADIIIFDPDEKKQERKVAIEIKLDCYHHKAIEKDFQKLALLKEKFRDIMPLFLYVKIEYPNFDSIMSKIKDCKKRYDFVRVIILDIDQKKVIEVDKQY